MARKRDLANKLSAQAEEQGARPGWRDAITGPLRDEPLDEEPQTGRRATSARRAAPQRREEVERRRARSPRNNLLMRKTYLLTPQLVDHIADLAETERVGINELVRFLLHASLESIENGALQIPTRPARRRIVPED